MTGASEAARKLIEKKIEEVGNVIAIAEARLVRVERELLVLNETEVEVRWIIEVFSQFNVLWDSMALENRARLIRAIISCVDVDERNVRISVSFRDIGVGRTEVTGESIEAAI